MALNSVDSLLCVFCRCYIIDSPRQALCGDRLCGACYSNLMRKQTSIPCPRCHEEITLQQCFRDKAVEMELASISLKCRNTGCPWEGESRDLNNHLMECRYAVVNCPNMRCGESVFREKLEDHLSNCPFNPVLCEFSGGIEKGIVDDREVAQHIHDMHYCIHELTCDEWQSCTNSGSEIRDTSEACSQQLSLRNGSGPGVDPGYLAGQSSSDPERYHPDNARKHKRLKCRKRGCKSLPISPSTTPTSDQPASPASEEAAGSMSPAAFAHGQDHAPFHFTSLGGRLPEVPVLRATTSDSEGPEPNAYDHQIQVPFQRVQTSSDSEGSEPHGHLVASKPPVEATRILVDPVYVQRQLWMLLEESMVDPATQLPARIMELIQQLDPQSFSAPTMTPLLPRQRSITGPPVSTVYPSSSQLAV